MAGSQVHSIFVHDTRIIIACQSMLYLKSDSHYEATNHYLNTSGDKLNEIDIMSDEADDLFESSVEICLNDTLLENSDTVNKDIMIKSGNPGSPKLIPVYKYKHPALAFDLQGDNLYSLHIKKSPYVDQDKPGQVNIDAFYIECCCITDFSCISGCISPFDIPDTEKTNTNWIKIIPACSVRTEFIEKHFPKTSDLFQSLDNLLLLFVFSFKETTRIIVMQENKETKGVLDKGAISVKTGWKHPVDLCSIRKKEPGRNTSNELADWIEELLSTQAADVGKLSLIYNPSNIRQVFTNCVGENCILVLFLDGSLVHYKRAGKELSKWKLPLKAIIACAFNTDKELYALSSSGILYKCSDIQSKLLNIELDLESNSSDPVQSLIDLTDIMEAVNLEKIKQQESLRQLQVFASILNDREYLKDLAFNAEIERYSSSYNQLQYRLVLNVGHVDDPKFLARFWNVMVTIELSKENDNERKFLQHTAKYPITHKRGCKWTTYMHIPEDIKQTSFPLSLSVQLLLNVQIPTCNKILKTNAVYQKKISALDFVFMKSNMHSDIICDPNGSNLSKPPSKIINKVTDVIHDEEQADTFEAFLTKLNESRPIHSLFGLENQYKYQGNTDISATHLFSFKICSDRLGSLSKHNRFFAELAQVIKRQERVASNYTTIFQYLRHELNVVVNETNNSESKGSIHLSFSTACNKMKFRSLKYAILNCLKCDLELQIQEIKNVIVPFQLAKTVDEIRTEVEALGIEENSETIAKYNKLYNYWRNTLNSGMFSLYGRDNSTI